MLHFKCAAVKLQSVNQRGRKKKQNQRFGKQQNSLGLFWKFKKHQSKHNVLWDFCLTSEKTFEKIAKMKVLLLQRPRVFGGSWLLKLVTSQCEQLLCAVVILKWLGSLEAYQPLWPLDESVTLLPWLKFGVTVCQDNNGHQQRLPGWLLNTSWSGCGAQSPAAWFRGSVLTHHRRR